MIVAVDNDIIEKCAFLGLLDELHVLLGCERDALRVLPTAKYRYGEKEPGKAIRKFGATLAADMLAFCHALAEVPSAHDDDATALQGVTDLDSGEVILMSFVSRTEGARLVTGDKRAIRALAIAPEGAAMVARLAGRVLCMEQIVERAIRRLGFEETRRLVVEGMCAPREVRSLAVDKVVGVCFGSGLRAERAAVTATLAVYVGELRTTSAGMLAAGESG